MQARRKPCGTVRARCTTCAAGGNYPCACGACPAAAAAAERHCCQTAQGSTRVTWRCFSFLIMLAMSGSTSDKGPSYCSSSRFDPVSAVIQPSHVRCLDLTLTFRTRPVLVCEAETPKTPGLPMTHCAAALTLWSNNCPGYMAATYMSHGSGTALRLKSALQLHSEWCRQ